jgi:hypothetical protein
MPGLVPDIHVDGRAEASRAGHGECQEIQRATCMAFVPLFPRKREPRDFSRLP